MLTHKLRAQRFAEYQARCEEMAEKAFGTPERLKEMYEIEVLGVDPDVQGHGYGTALVREMLKMVGSVMFSVIRCT